MTRVYEVIDVTVREYLGMALTASGAFRPDVSRSGLTVLGALLSSHRLEAASTSALSQSRLADAGLLSADGKVGEPSGAGMTVNVRDFGARGDGVADDAPAINAAIQAVRERHKRVGRFDLGC